MAKLNREAARNKVSLVSFSEIDGRTSSLGPNRRLSSDILAIILLLGPACNLASKPRCIAVVFGR